MTFDAAAAKALYDALKSVAQKVALFQAVDTHEPVSAPGNRLYCSIVLGPMGAAPSGLNVTSGKITFGVRVWSAAMQRPLEDIDPEVLAAVAKLMAALSAGFTLGGIARNIDLLAMTAVPGWVDAEGKQYRVMEITVPIVINDMFEQEA